MFHPSDAALVLVGLLAIGGPISSLGERAFLRSSPGTAAKIAYYRVSMALQWLLAAAAVWALGVDALMRAPQPQPAWLAKALPVQIGLAVVFTGYFGLAMAPLAGSLISPRLREAYRRGFQTWAREIPAFLPANARERVWFALLAVTAGVCEEILFRGLMIRSLQGGPIPLTGLALHLSPTAALLAASAIFGLCHLYQGPKGVLATALGGLVFGTLYLMTGSLILPMILHAAVDLQVPFVLAPGSRDEPAPGAQAPHPAG